MITKPTLKSLQRDLDALRVDVQRLQARIEPRLTVRSLLARVPRLRLVRPTVGEERS